MTHQITSVALTDTFDTWRIRTNTGFTNLFQVAPNPNTINASNTVTGGSLVTTGLASAGSLTVSGSGATALNSANTNVAGGTLLITSNTNINGTLLLNGAAPGTDDNALAFAIALG